MRVLVIREEKNEEKHEKVLRNSPRASTLHFTHTHTHTHTHTPS